MGHEWLSLTSLNHVCGCFRIGRRLFEHHLLLFDKPDLISSSVSISLYHYTLNKKKRIIFGIVFLIYCWTHSTYQLREVSFFSSWYVCVYIIKSSKLSQWCEVSVLALRKGKVHTQLFNWKQLRHYTTAKILRLIYLPMPVHVLILGIAYTLNFSLSVYFATQASTLLPSAEFDALQDLELWLHDFTVKLWSTCRAGARCTPVWDLCFWDLFSLIILSPPGSRM